MPVAGTRIRPAGEDDLVLLGVIEVVAGKVFRTVGLDIVADDDPPTPAELRCHVVDGTIWVAEAPSGEPVGYARASVVDGDGHLDQVSVRPDSDSRGIGTALIERVCTWAASSGLEAVTLTTYRDLAWNGSFYERLGFRTIPDAELTPGLAAIRTGERRRGLDAQPRVAMRRLV